jgi:hypothetical protein
MDTVRLKKIGGSYYFKLPLSYRHKFDYETGDPFHLIPNGDGTVLKLIRADEENQPAKNWQVEQEVTEAAE